MTTTSSNRPVVVFVLGGPGSGKGTQCSRIESEFGFVHVSAGDCLREERNVPGSEYGQMIDEYIKDGRIVPVEVTVKLLLNKMKAKGWEKRMFLIDGFPRNQDNWEGWLKCMRKEGPGSDVEETGSEKMNNSIVDVRMCLFFECEEEEMERRLLGRGAHSGRLDDNMESIRKRFRTFVSETMPIVENFEKLGKLQMVNAMRTIDEVWDNVRKVFVNQSLA